MTQKENDIVDAFWQIVTSYRYYWNILYDLTNQHSELDKIQCNQGMSHMDQFVYSGKILQPSLK